MEPKPTLASPPTLLSPRQIWCPPDRHWYKANFDRAFFKNIDAAGLGVVIHDHDGEVIGVLSMRIPLPHSVAEVEALASCCALQFATKIKLKEVIFEGNSADRPKTY